MYFVQINKNIWKCVADGPRDPATGKRKQISRRGKSKTEAKKRVEEAIAQIEASQVYSEKIVFEEFTGKWIELYKLKGNKETTVEYRTYCLSLVSKSIAKAKIVNITAKQLQEVLNDLFESGTAFYTLRGTHNALNLLFKYAVESGLIPLNPMAAVFVPKKKAELVEDLAKETAKLFLEAKELKQFLEVADNFNNVLYRTIIYTIAFTGMRPGEALALKFKDVDLEKKTISVTKTVYAKKSIRGDFELTTPKTKNANRTIDIDDLLVEKIQFLFDYRISKDWIISEYFFGDYDGIPPTVKTLYQAVRRLGRNTGIEKNFSTYILRHTHISLLAEAGVDLHYIMNRVGHRNSKTTTEIYLHVTEGMRENISQKMHAKFTELLTTTQEK